MKNIGIKIAMMLLIWSQMPLECSTLSLHRQTSNYIVNGDFEQPRVAPNWNIFANAPGWNGLLEIGSGTIYNSRWNSQVVELDADKNELIKQDITLPVAGKYTLKYQCAARAGLVSTSKMNVYWNGVKIDFIEPADENIISKEVLLDGKQGVNTIAFEGAGNSDSLGITLDNIELIKNNTVEFNECGIPNCKSCMSPAGGSICLECANSLISDGAQQFKICVPNECGILKCSECKPGSTSQCSKCIEGFKVSGPGENICAKI